MKIIGKENPHYVAHIIKVSLISFLLSYDLSDKINAHA